MSELTTTLAGLMSANTNTSTNTTKKPTELWLNIVFVVGTDADGNPVEVSLPYGLDLTNMPARKVGNTDSEFNQMLTNQNALLEQLRAQGASRFNPLKNRASFERIQASTELVETISFNPLKNRASFEPWSSKN